MDNSTPSSTVSSESTSRESDDLDRSAPLSSSRVLRRALRDDSGQEYFVYAPGNGAVDAPVVVAIHDIERDARSLAESLATICERQGVVLVAPHFTTDRFPNYQRFGRSRNPADEGRSASEALDLILQEVAVLSGVSTTRIHLLGFGSGGRFAMRYSMLNPDGVTSAVIVEPGAYTFPDESRRFPRGIAPSRKRPDFQPDPDRFLRVPISLFEYEGEPVAPLRARLEEVDAEIQGDSAANGRSWASAMVDAAVARDLAPNVSFDALEEPIEASDVFLGDEERLAGFFDRLVSGVSLQHEQVANPQSMSSEGQDTQAGWLRMRELRRYFVPGILLIAVVAVTTPIFLWAHYRSTHVISRDAVLRGHIAEVGAQLNGVVKQIEVDSGDRVSAGEIVVRLEDRHFKAKRIRAESQLEKARRELEVERLAIANERAQQKSSLRGVSADLSAAHAELEAAESLAEEARRRLELQRSLSAQGLVAEERVRTAETELRTAQARVSASRAGRTSARAGQDLAETVYDGLAVREKRISVLESEIAALEAEVALAQANLESTIIRAPDDGAVVRRIVEPGGSTVVGQPIISLWLGREIWVEAWIDEDEFGQVAVGSRATVTFKSHPDREFSGTVESLAVATDIELPDSEVPQPRKDRMRDAPVVSARVVLDPHQEDLFPGLSAVVAIHKKEP